MYNDELKQFTHTVTERRESFFICRIHENCPKIMEFRWIVWNFLLIIRFPQMVNHLSPDDFLEELSFSLEQNKRAGRRFLFLKKVKFTFSFTKKTIIFRGISQNNFLLKKKLLFKIFYKLFLINLNQVKN